MVLAVHGTTRQRRCFQEGYLTYVCGEEQNIAVMSSASKYAETCRTFGMLGCSVHPILMG